MGVTFFGDDAPDEFGKFDRALITMYRLTAGDTWVCPGTVLPCNVLPNERKGLLDKPVADSGACACTAGGPVFLHDTGTGSRKIRSCRSFRMNDECYPPSSFNNVRKLAS